MFSHRLKSPTAHPGLPISLRRSFLMLSAILILLLVWGGCGGQDQKEVLDEGDVLATVNGTPVTSLDYEESLKVLLPSQLPLDGQGVGYDMASEAGKAVFLDILINQELLIDKAVKLGYADDEEMVKGRESALAGVASWKMSNDFIQEPSANISEEELQELYSRLGMERACLFLITNTEEEALAARELAIQGEDWGKIVRQYHRGLMPPQGLGKTKVVFGYTDEFFDSAVFAVKVGEVTPPIQTGTGFWILKAISEKQGPRPDLENSKPLVLDIAHRRKKEKVGLAFMAELRQLHEVKISEETLLIAYEGLDPNEFGRDLETGRPKEISDMAPMKVASRDLDRFFYSYIVKGKTEEATLGEYLEHFDRMGAYQRPIHAGLIGGMRTKIRQELERLIISDEAQVRGYYDDPEVIRKTDKQMNEFIRDRFVESSVSIDEVVSVAAKDAFFEQNKDGFIIPETRDGLLVICKDLSTAQRILDEAAKGTSWDFLFSRFDVDQENRAKNGVVSLKQPDARPRTAALFGLAKKNELSEPFPMDKGRFGVVKLVDIHATRAAERSEMTSQLGSLIRQERQEAAMKKLLDSLHEEAEIKIFMDKLPGLPSYEEVVSKEELENVVTAK